MLRYFLVSTLVLGVVKCQGDQYLPPNKGYDYPKPNREFPAPPPTRGVPPSRPPPTYGQPPVLTKTSPVEDHHHEPGMPFDFAYAVNEDGNDYSHNAISDGDVTRGEYRVALPDGRMQIVKYTADWKNGFNAEVSYEGEAKYPEQSAQIRAGPSNQYIPPNQQPAAGGYKY